MTTKPIETLDDLIASIRVPPPYPNKIAPKWDVRINGERCTGCATRREARLFASWLREHPVLQNRQATGRRCRVTVEQVEWAVRVRDRSSERAGKGGAE